LPSSSAEYLQNPRPEYPRASQLRGEQGRVVVHVLIGADGRAQKAEIKSSSGFQRLDQVALTTVLAWRYVPGKRAGVPETMWFSVPLNFVLDR
jgi:protein TonB